MTKSYAKDLFQLQSELVDTKVDMAVSKAIDKVVEQLIDLKGQMNAKFSQVNHQVDSKFAEVNKQLSRLEVSFSKLEHRVDKNEKTLNSITNGLAELRTKAIAYSFRGGWVVLAGIILILVSQLTQLFHSFVS